MAAFFGGGGECCDNVRRQAGEVGAAGDEDRGVLIRQ
jgi:hypothetical protein